MVRRRGTLWIAMLALLAGCVVPPSGEPSRAYLDRLHKRARDVLARFDSVRDAGGSPRGDPVGIGGHRGLHHRQPFSSGALRIGTCPHQPQQIGAPVRDGGRHPLKQQRNSRSCRLEDFAIVADARLQPVLMHDRMGHADGSVQARLRTSRRRCVRR